MQTLIAFTSAGFPAALTEAMTLGLTLKHRAADMLVYFDRPGTSHGSTEALNGRLKHFRGSAQASATSLITSPDHFWKPVASDHGFTLKDEEPLQ